MRLRVSHQTTYRYDKPVPYGLQQVRLFPKSRSDQTVHNWNIAVTGGKRECEFEDQHNNHVLLIATEEGESEIAIFCEGEVTTIANDGVIGQHGGYAPLWYFRRATDLVTPGPLVRELADGLGDDFDGEIARLHGLSNLIADKVIYQAGETGPQTTAEEALALGKGVCQDHAQIFVTAARLIGYPARYVSGYLMMNDRIQQEATHAWAEAYLDNLGWVGFDVSNGISPDERYIRVATGLDYREAAPISGMRLGGGNESLNVSVEVQQ